VSNQTQTSRFGSTIEIINGGLECRRGPDDYRVANRIGHYRRYIRILGEEPEAVLHCDFPSF